MLLNRNFILLKGNVIFFENGISFGFKRLVNLVWFSL